MQGTGRSWDFLQADGASRAQQLPVWTDRDSLDCGAVG